jgi:hypothetical protein
MTQQRPHNSKRLWNQRIPLLKLDERDVLLRAKQILESREEAIFQIVRTGMLAPREWEPAWDEHERLRRSVAVIGDVLKGDQERRAVRTTDPLTHEEISAQDRGEPGFTPRTITRRAAS